MNVLPLTLLLCGCYVLSTSSEVRSIDDDFELHKAKYSLSFSSAEEEAAAKQNYQKVDDVINKHNAEADEGKHTYRMGHNQLSHLSDEVKSAMNGAIVPSGFKTRVARSSERRDNTDLPESIDWRNVSGVSYVISPINQGRCGSCWAYSATATLESHWAILNKLEEPTKLSEQNIVDCAYAGAYSKSANNCNGGWYSTAWDYVASFVKGKKKQLVGRFQANNKAWKPKKKKIAGQNTLKFYPYRSQTLQKGQPGNCAFRSSQRKIGATASSVSNSAAVEVKADDAQAMMEAVATKGPVSVAMMVINSFYQYSSGIYSSDDCNTSVNHAVSIIGYGDSCNGTYWLLKNSWGTSWGEDGYFKFPRNATATDSGMCNILSYGEYPVIYS